MKAIKKKSFLQLVLVLFAVLCVFLCSGMSTLDRKDARAEVRAVYTNAYIGDIIEAKNYKMRTAGGDVVAESMRIVYPSGGIYGSDSFVIEQTGKYQVTYYATVGGNRIEETKTYMAIRRPQDMIIADTGMKVEYGKYYVESPYELTKETYGARVHFKAGQSITFASNLRVADLTQNYTFLSMIVEPSVYGETDFEKLTVRLTDVNDENNYIEYLITSSNLVDGAGMTSYVKAGAMGRQYGGYEGSRFHMRNYGTSVDHSFRAWGHYGEDPQRVNKTVSENPITFAVDHESKKIYCGPASNTSAHKLMVNDLDDPAHYKSDAWEGFTADEVTVSVKADSFAKSEGVVVITSYGGYNFANDIVDNTAPTISLDYDMTDRLPVAEVGTRFPMIPFTAKDALDKTVKTSIWVNHINQNGKKITVENDGESFYVEYAGTYEIIYCAEDYSGNKSEKRVEITAQETAPNIYISIDEALVEEDIYNTVFVPYVWDMNIYGGSGTLKTERAVYSPSKKLLDIKDTLQLTELGDYKVVYQATDYYGKVGYGVITIRSTMIDAPKFVDEPKFTDVLIKDFTYEFPKALVVETVNGEVIELPCKTYVNDTLKDGSFKADGEEVVIRYVAEGATGTVTWEDTISVVNTEKGMYKSSYFYTEDELQIIDEKNYLEFAFNDEAKAIFVNPISSQNLSISFMFEQDKTNFAEMVFVIKDVASPELTVTLRFFYNAPTNAWTLQSNDGFPAVAYAESKGILSFTYVAGNYTIVDTNGEEVVVLAVYDNGEPFKGFSDSVYWEVAFEGVRSESSMYLRQLCNQSMGYNKSSLDKATDEIKPIIVLDEVFLLRQKLGSEAKIPTAKAFDVLGQITEFTVSLEKDGKLLASGPADKSISWVLDAAGSYNVTYFAKDTNSNKMSLPYMILVSDETAPALSVENSLKSSYKVGDKVAIPKYSATDNDGNCTIQVMVVLPDNEMRLLHYVENGKVTSLLSKENNIYDASFKADDNTFITEKKGLYVLRIVAYDEYYNYTVVEIEFQVK